MPRSSNRSILLAATLALLLVSLSVSPFCQNVTARSSAPNILLVFTGDIMPARKVEEMSKIYSDRYHPYYGIDNYTQIGDITCGNLETTVSVRGEPARLKRFNFQVDAQTLQPIKDAGFDVLSLANNHILDYGPDAALDTKDNIEDHGMKQMGLWYLNDPVRNARIPRVAFIETKGITFAFLGYTEYFWDDFLATANTPGPCPIDLELIKNDIEYAREQADVIIVSLHWFYDEYDKTPNPDEIRICKAVCDLGVDILANHGHHVLQDVEYYNGSLIMHCLGNTVFDQSIKSTHKSTIAMVYMKGAELDSLELIPLRKNDLHQYIPRGNILKEDIKEGLFLNWTDFDSRMFNSKRYLTDYKGADPVWYEPIFSIPVALTALGGILVIACILLGDYYWRKRKRKPRNKS